MEIAPQQVTTSPDPFGIFQKYTLIPSHNPDNTDPFSNISTSSSAAPQTSSARRIGSDLNVSSVVNDSNPLVSSKNPTDDLLLGWWSKGSCDGVASLNRLVKCLKSPYFDLSQLKDFNATNAVHQFEKSQSSSNPRTTLKPGDGWKTGLVKIRLPCTGVKQCEQDALEFTVNGILYQDAVEVIMRELQDPDSFECIHIKLFEEWWKPSKSNDPVHVYSNVFMSNAMLEADRQLQDSLKAAASAGPQLETFIISALFYSDSTCLTTFSNAAL